MRPVGANRRLAPRPGDGQLNGAAAPQVHRDRRKHLDLPYPGGESWR